MQGTYYTSDKEPDGIENATHTTFPKKLATEMKNPAFLKMYCGLHF
jgi:hypothetical protein